MPTPDEINLNKEKLYESASLRDDLNDDEATVLLKWGEAQVERLAKLFPDEFEQKARFLRQLIKNINRFVGQREFNEREGQQKYMSKVSMYLEALGWNDITEDQIFEALPEDKANMSANLAAILNILPASEATLDTKEHDSDPTILAGIDQGEFASSAPLHDVSPEGDVPTDADKWHEDDNIYASDD